MAAEQDFVMENAVSFAGKGVSTLRCGVEAFHVVAAP
jgi:hypothetical protein